MKGETLSFKMHPDLLYSVIQSQAGSLTKGLIESIMNSVDAGSTRIDLTLDSTSYSVKDDGRGFASRKQIDEFFRTFGHPHKEGDAIYGRFRIGRGQGFSFAINRWRTGQFEMNVDIKNKGLDFVLFENLPHADGCLIEGQLYTPLSPTELIATQRELATQCLFTPIPVFLNGKQINKDVAKEKWDYETEDAYIILRESQTMNVYNLGILVNSFRASEFGSGGIVVSKKNLNLNFARNDVMRNTCEVWKRIKPYLRNLSDQRVKSKGVKITEEWRCMKAMEVLNANSPSLSYNEIYELLNAPVFTDVSGKHFSLRKLGTGKKPVTIGQKGDFQADRVSQLQMAIVLDEDLIHSRFNIDLLSLLKSLTSKSNSSSGKTGLDAYSWMFTNILDGYQPLEFYTSSFNSNHDIVEIKTLSNTERLVLKLMNNISLYVNYLVAQVIEGEGVFKPEKRREIMVMQSDTADAFTDGVKTVYFHRQFLSGKTGPQGGLAWAIRVVNIMIHEYCHDFNSGVGHTHDSEFYQHVHDIILRPKPEEDGKGYYWTHGDIAIELFNSYVKEAQANMTKLSRKAGAQANTIHMAEQQKLKFEQVA